MELTDLGCAPAFVNDTITTTSEESAAEDEADPTIDLAPIVVTEKWTDPPSRGSGWWGRGPPLQVHHNYNSKDIGDVAKDLIIAMGVDLGKFEQRAYNMFAGKLSSSPFPPEEIVKRKAFFNDWCKSWGCPGGKDQGAYTRRST